MAASVVDDDENNIEQIRQQELQNNLQIDDTHGIAISGPHHQMYLRMANTH